MAFEFQGRKVMSVSTLIFALAAIVLQPIASGMVPERHVSYVENIRGSLYLNEVSATTMGSLASSSSLGKYQIEKVSYNYLVIRVVFGEPMYLQDDRDTGSSNTKQPIRLGKHEDGDLQNAVQVHCGHREHGPSVDFATAGRIRLCNKTSFDKTFFASQQTNFSGCMFDLSSANRDASLKASKINLIYDSMSEEYCGGHTPNVLCLLLKDDSSTDDFHRCRIIFATDANGTKAGHGHLGTFQGEPAAASRATFPVLAQHDGHVVHNQPLVAFVGMDTIAFHKFLDEPFYRQNTDEYNLPNVTTGVVENAEKELNRLKKGQCKIINKFLNNETKDAKEALLYGAELNDGSVMSAVELHQTLHTLLQDSAKDGSSESEGEAPPAEEPEDGAGEIWEILLGAIPSLIQKLFSSEDPREKEEMVHQMNELLPEALGAEVPHIVSEMLQHALTYNLTNIITDSVTAAVVPRISSAVFEGVAETIQLTIYHQTTNRVPVAVTKTLVPTLTERVNRALPRFLERALACRLVWTLTRSISHAVVPVLSKSLTHDKHQEYYCYLCYHHQVHCRLCHNSPQTSYYNNYYGAYYTDYYSKYYSDYYTESCSKKELEWPDAAPPPTPAEPPAEEPPKEPEKPQSEKECKAYLASHQKGGTYDCHDNGRARDAGNQQECIDKVLGKSDPFGDGRKVNVVHNWGNDGKCA